jgi:hypothetical protein
VIAAARSLACSIIRPSSFRDHIADLHGHLVGWTSSFHRIHEHSERPIESERARERVAHILKGKADVAPIDAAVPNEPTHRIASAIRGT